MSCGLPSTYSGHDPLPSCIKLGDSAIHGMGLFAVGLIEEWHIIGVSHVVVKDRHIAPLQRTVLGSYINHGEDPNCFLVTKGSCYLLCAARDIEQGEELTLDYSNEPCGICQ